MIRQTVYFSGRVQGVGFRYTVQALAGNFPGISGFVQNLDDGRVQIVIEGSESDVAALLASVRDRMGANIHSADEETSSVTGEFGGFRVRH